jgi:hypothetical protein
VGILCDLGKTAYVSILVGIDPDLQDLELNASIFFGDLRRQLLQVDLTGAGFTAAGSACGRS